MKKHLNFNRIKKLNWFPKIPFNQLVKEMIDEDLKLAKSEVK